jgi:hypothetical protein
MAGPPMSRHAGFRVRRVDFAPSQIGHGGRFRGHDAEVGSVEALRRPLADVHRYRTAAAAPTSTTLFAARRGPVAGKVKVHGPPSGEPVAASSRVGEVKSAPTGQRAHPVPR